MGGRETRGGGLLAYFTRHRTAANLILVLMIAAGVAAIPRMRAQFFPDIVSDTVTVSVRWEGAGAQDVDNAIVQILEPALLAVEGVVASDARSTEGSARVRVEFEPGTDMARAEEDVQAALDGMGNLPEDAEDPQIQRSRWSDRVTDVVIAGPVGVDQLALYADEFSQMLFRAGVTRTSVEGVAAPATVVEVPSISLIRHDIGLSDISAAIAREVSADAAGEVEGAARVRTGTEKRTAEEIEGIVLRRNTDGTTLTVGDVATVSTLGADRDSAYYVGPDQAVQVRVDRSQQGDAIAIQETVADVARRLEATLPAGTTLTLTNSSAEEISGRLALLIDNGLMGLGLVVLLLFLFLNARTALWVAAGIPVSMAAAVALMYALGLTFNMISLFALILTLGIVVDDAIVVGEHADFRVRNLGESAVEAAGNAARRMFTPVFSATLTTIIAFFGLVVIGGRFGTFIADIPWTVIAVLTASLVECFLILPNHLAHSIAVGKARPWYDWPSRQVNRGFGWIRDRLFRPFVAGVIWARYPVLALTVVLLAMQAAQLVRGDVQWRFFSQPEQGSVTGNFSMLPAATREDTLAMMAEMQRATEALGQRLEDEHGTNPVTFAIAQIGGGAGRGLSGAETKESWQLGSITVNLIDADLRPYSSGEFVQMLQDSVVAHPLAETVSFRRWGGGPGGDSIDIQLSGADADTLKEAAEALKTALARFPEVSGLEDTLAYDREELVLELTPHGQALGFTIDGLGRTLRERLNGIEAATFPLNGRSAAIRVELPEDELTADFLDRTQMRTANGDYVPLADIVTVDRTSGFSSILRENGVLLISVLGELDDGDADRAAEIQKSIEEEILPAVESRYGVSSALSGLAEQEQEFLSDAQVALVFTLTGIYLVLAWIFSSWTRPLVVMSIIPFGLVGAVYGHGLWDVPMSMFSIVGLIGMVGIIINDSIVLVTTIDEYSEGRGLFPAIIDGASDRLRPVFLTTATTVLGLAPLLYEGSIQAEFLKPTVITLVYGLGFGMVLVLIVVPALIAAQSDIGRQWRAARRALRGGGGPATAVALLGAAGAAALGVGLFGPAMFGLPLPGALSALAPDGFGAALGLFLAALAVWLVVLYLAGTATMALRRRTRAG
ncbi:efflux RND transporter permease subunit [Wenxinia marina]|uniref:Cation/multidrug efflux pump n=1 Tax=Wenxinia marina DSM 24838 TaxID=1123501 RepID=A0A0D0QIJ4_9RHOB|nr:efflux RND transporter permease subunit [Wenxinia marina]KIQ70893.1 Cation/multidrug efflux pump [Wenxinia marina DSM 24838]GGL56473.1 acriflavin resistance protein [Wenxinia marina]